MAAIEKYSGSDTYSVIKHNMREIESGKEYRNEDIDKTMTETNNYSLLDDRCQNAKEANQYRKDLEKDIFKYNRKDIVHSVEVVIQCPADCPIEQKADFFRETYNYVASLLPMGEKCIFLAQVHGDEHKIITDALGEKTDISKDHLHIMYVPAVRDDKHPGYEYKLCADQLTKRKNLKEFHPGLQKHLDECGIKATVTHKKEGSGRNIKLSVKELKAITDSTGIVIDKSLSYEQLGAILKENEVLRNQVKELTAKVAEYERERASSWGSSSSAWGANCWGNNSEEKIW